MLPSIGVNRRNGAAQDVLETPREALEFAAPANDFRSAITYIVGTWGL